MRARDLFELARSAQWVKNGFVLLPLFFGQALFQRAALTGALLATLAFCFVSSAVYALNDVVDAERDRAHPRKRERPVARGAVTRAQALTFAVVSAAFGFAVASCTSFGVVAVLALYVAMQIVYSLVLKRFAFVDVAIVATGFVLRILAGGYAAGVPLTPWIVVMGFLLALLLALGKRHADLFHATATAPSGYRQRAVEWVLAALGGAVCAAYVLYTISPAVLERHGHHPLYFSTPWVALGLLRYLWLALVRGAGGDPSRLALTDPPLLIAVAGWLGTLALIMYR